MQSKIEQTKNAIISTIINESYKAILTQKVDKKGNIHIIRELFEGEELIEREEYIRCKLCK